MLQCELLALLIVKFNAFTRSFDKDKTGELIQVWDLLPWVKNPDEDKKPKHGLFPWLDK